MAKGGVTVSVDKKDQMRFDRAIKKLVLLSDEPVEDILKSQGRLFAVDAAKFTERFGSKASIGRGHKKRVEDDVGRVYKNAKNAIGLIARHMGKKSGIRFANYIRRRNLAKAEQMVEVAGLSGKYYDGRKVNVIMFDGGKAHERLKGGGMKGKPPVNLVCDYPKVKKYRNAEKKKVGFLKSGWADAARDLGGTRGIPAYVNKGHARSGRGSVTGRSHKAVLYVANFAKYIFNNTNASKLFKLRIKKIEALIVRMIRSKAKKITRKV
jgi:hypothetical protein